MRGTLLRALVVGVAALCAASAVALPLVNRPDVETAAVLPETPAPPLAGTVIARPAPVRPELASPETPRPRRDEPRGSSLPARSPAQEDDVVRMPEAEPSIVVVAAPVGSRDQEGRLLAHGPAPQTGSKPNVRIAPDLPADALVPTGSAPPPGAAPERKERRSQD